MSDPIDLRKVLYEQPKDITQLTVLLKNNDQERQAYVLRMQVYINWLQNYQSRSEIIRRFAESSFLPKIKEMIELSMRFRQEEFPALYNSLEIMKDLLAKANVHVTMIDSN